jgi:hypothetical protein
MKKIKNPMRMSSRERIYNLLGINSVPIINRKLIPVCTRVYRGGKRYGVCANVLEINYLLENTC